MKLKEKVIDV